MALAEGSPYRAKGSHLVQAEAWIDERLGTGTFGRLLGEAQGLPVGVLLPGRWYDVEPFNVVLGHVARRVGQSVEDISMEIARLNALRDLTTMYRVFMRIAAPQRVMSHTPRLWSTYVAFGDARAAVNEAGRYVGEGSGIPLHLLDWVCGAWRGFIPAAIEVAGGKDVTGRILSRGQDDAGVGRLQFEARYRS